MKQLLKIAIIFIAMTPFVIGCNPYDDSELSARVDDLENRVDVLEDRLDEFQTSVDECVTLVNQFKAEKRIKDFKEDPNGNGYIIEFVDGKTMHIKNGEVPELSVIFDETLQEYVWTANGEVVMDKTTGEPVRAYIAPEFEVRDGKLGYTLGGEWHEVTNGETVGLIADVITDDEGVTFVLSSGSTIVIPKVGFRLNIEYFEYGAEAGQTVNINYSITDGDANTEILLYPDEGYTAIEEYGTIKVTLPSENPYAGKVFVVAVNGKGAVSGKIIRFGELVTEITSASIVKVGKSGGDVTLNVRSNRPYNWQFDQTQLPPDWIIPLGNLTKAGPREDAIGFHINENTDAGERQATIDVVWMPNFEGSDFINDQIKKSFVIIQLDTKDVAVDKPMDKDGNPYKAYSSGDETSVEGKMDGNWVFTNCAVVDNASKTNQYIPDGELRLALNGIKDKKGVLTSPTFENGIGTLFIYHGGNRTVATQDTRFKVEWFRKSDKTLIDSKEIYYKGLKKELYKEEIDINCSEPCYIVITNTSTRATSLKTGLVNCSIFYSMFYSEYKAE